MLWLALAVSGTAFRVLMELLAEVAKLLAFGNTTPPAVVEAVLLQMLQITLIIIMVTWALLVALVVAEEVQTLLGTWLGPAGPALLD
jgi:hypothetical protein